MNLRTLQDDLRMSSGIQALRSGASIDELETEQALELIFAFMRENTEVRRLLEVISPKATCCTNPDCRDLAGTITRMLEKAYENVANCEQIAVHLGRKYGFLKGLQIDYTGFNLRNPEHLVGFQHNFVYCDMVAQRKIAY